MILHAKTLKAARALLNWTAQELASASGVPIDTLRSFESGRSKTMSRANEEAVRRAVEAAGVAFLDTGDVAPGPGVAVKGL